MWGRVAKHVLWKAEEKRKARCWELPFGGENDDEYAMRGMMWDDNYWLFCDNEGGLVCMVNDIIEELLDFQTGISVVDKHVQKRGCGNTEGGKQRENLELAFHGGVRCLGLSFPSQWVKGFQGTQRTICKGMGSWWRDRCIYRSKTVPMIVKSQSS